MDNKKKGSLVSTLTTRDRRKDLKKRQSLHVVRKKNTQKSILWRAPLSKLCIPIKEKWNPPLLLEKFSDLLRQSVENKEENVGFTKITQLLINLDLKNITNGAELEQLVKDIEENDDICHLLELPENDLVALIKLFFRELPEKTLDFEVPQTKITGTESATSCKDISSIQLQAIVSRYRKLPLPSYCTAKFLFELLFFFSNKSLETCLELGKSWEPLLIKSHTLSTLEPNFLGISIFYHSVIFTEPGDQVDLDADPDKKRKGTKSRGLSSPLRTPDSNKFSSMLSSSRATSESDSDKKKDSFWALGKSKSMKKQYSKDNVAQKDEDEEEEEEDPYFHVISLYDYFSEEPGQLSFNKDQKFFITKLHEDGWAEGWLFGKRGFFPSYYVKFMENVQ